LSEYVIDDRENHRFRVNREAMADPAVLALERTKIFDRSWLYIGHEPSCASPTTSGPGRWPGGR